MSGKAICVLAGVIGLAAKRIAQQDAGENSKLHLVHAVAEQTPIAINREWLKAQNVSEIVLSGHIKIPASATSIDSHVFRWQELLKTIDLTEATNLKSIGQSAFRSSGIESITIPASVTSIGIRAFQAAINLTTVDLSRSKLTEISGATFRWCSKLENVTLPSSVRNISHLAFWRTLNLKTIDLPKAVTHVYEGAFGCSGLKKITIPAENLQIDEDAFLIRNWESLDVNASENVKANVTNTFKKYDDETYFNEQMHEYKGTGC